MPAVRLDLTAMSLQELDDLERSIGSAIPEIVERGSAKDVRDLAVALMGEEDDPLEKVNGLRPGELTFDIDGTDLPSMFNDYLPDTGGWTADRFICFFAGPPWHWPPDVTLRQSVRHLRLLQDAFDGWSPA